MLWKEAALSQPTRPLPQAPWPGGLSLARVCMDTDVGRERGGAPPASACQGSRPALCQAGSEKETTVRPVL